MVPQNLGIARLTYSEHAQCDFPGDLALVPEVAGKVRAYCSHRGLDAQAWAAVEVALVEGLNNAIEHGCRQAKGGDICVRWQWLDEILSIEILDPGDFLPTSATAQLPEPLAERGRGTFVMSALMDRVSHERRDGSHLLLLEKRLGLPKEVGADADTALQGMIGELGNSYESITALFRFGEELATARSFDVFVEQVFRRLLKLIKGDEACLWLDDGENRLKRVCSAHASGGDSLPEFMLLENNSLEAQVFLESEQRTVEDCSGLSTHDPLRRERGCAFACPILFRDATVGVLSIIRERTAPYFTAGETQLIGVVADFLGIARRMALSQEQRQAQQRTERELEIAAEIQQSLLPKTFPETGRFRVFGLSESANVVGGDYFDVLTVGDKGVLVAIADVMGKGMPAALLATILRTTIRAHAGLAEDPGRLLTMVNRQLSSDLNSLGMFITAQIAYLSHANDEVIFATAGHCPILKFLPGATQASQCQGGDVPLGVLEEIEYQSLRTPVAPGDRLLFLTDGICEAESASGEMLGLDFLVRQVPTLCVAAPATACRRLLDHVNDFAAGAVAADDRTLLIVQCL